MPGLERSESRRARPSRRHGDPPPISMPALALLARRGAGRGASVGVPHARADQWYRSVAASSRSPDGACLVDGATEWIWLDGTGSRRSRGPAQ